jgi:YD repeat-containing protein
VTGELSRVREWNPATGQPGNVLATFAYDDRGRRTSLTRGNGTVTSYTYDRASRLTQMVQDVPDASRDLTLGFGYNPASQIVSNSRSNDAYAQAPQAGTQTATANGLNQLAQVSGASTAHYARGNMTSDGSASYAYTSDNLMRSGPGGILLYYDPLNRLVQVSGTPVTRFTHDGANLIAEWSGSDQLQRRYVFADGVDEPIVSYEGTGIANRTYLHADERGSDELVAWFLPSRWFAHTDERGSVIALTDDGGNLVRINRYDEYGRPNPNNWARPARRSASARTGPWRGEGARPSAGDAERCEIVGRADGAAAARKLPIRVRTALLGLLLEIAPRALAPRVRWVIDRDGAGLVPDDDQLVRAVLLRRSGRCRKSERGGDAQRAEQEEGTHGFSDTKGALATGITTPALRVPDEAAPCGRASPSFPFVRSTP